MAIVQSAEALIGKTPLLRLNRLFPNMNIYAKLEYLNPAGSAKDRAARSMLDDLEARGLLKPGGTVVEPTSGNTGVALAALCAARGYQLVLTMPETMSAERRMLLSAYGAKLVLTPGGEGMAGAVKRADEIIQATPGAVLAGRFDNPANPAAHERTTGPEIWDDLGKGLAAIVAGVGTGGTITGTARYLKRQNPPCAPLPWSRLPRRCFRRGTPGRTASWALAQTLCQRRSTAACWTKSAPSRMRKPMPWPGKWRGAKACWWASLRARRWRRQSAWRRGWMARWWPYCPTAANAICLRGF